MRDDPDDEEDAQIAYVKTRVKGKANDHLYPFLDAKRDMAVRVHLEDVIYFLERIFEDPNRRVSARAELKALKMPFLGDFSTFQAEFTRLANIARMNTDDWKEEMHDRTYGTLKVRMEKYVTSDKYDFYRYCEKAQSFSRVLAETTKTNKERRERSQAAKAAKVIQNPAGSGLAQKVTDRQVEKGIREDSTPAGKTLNDGKCFNCNKKGHIARECPERKAEAKTIEPVHEENDSGNESL